MTTQDEIDMQAFEVWYQRQRCHYPERTAPKEVNAGFAKSMAESGYRAGRKHQREASAKELADMDKPTIDYNSTIEMLRSALVESQAREVKTLSDIRRMTTDLHADENKQQLIYRITNISHYCDTETKTRNHSTLDSAISKAVANALRGAAAKCLFIEHSRKNIEEQTIYDLALMSCHDAILALIPKPEKG